MSTPNARTSNAIRRFLSSIGKKGGRMRTKRLSAAQRSAIAKVAADARWAREKAKTR